MNIAARVLAGMLVALFGALGVVWLASLFACTTQQKADTVAGVDLGVCVLEHYGEPIAQILQPGECGGDVQQVTRLLEAERVSRGRAGCSSKDGGQ